MNRYIVSRGDNRSAIVFFSARTTDTKRPVRFVLVPIARPGDRERVRGEDLYGYRFGSVQPERYVFLSAHNGRPRPERPGCPTSCALLVRVIVPVENGDTQGAVDTAVSFVQSMFKPLRQYLPA